MGIVILIRVWYNTHIIWHQPGRTAPGFAAKGSDDT